jgi:hypothetical protein
VISVICGKAVTSKKKQQITQVVKAKASLAASKKNENKLLSIQKPPLGYYGQAARLARTPLVPDQRSTAERKNNNRAIPSLALPPDAEQIPACSGVASLIGEAVVVVGVKRGFNPCKSRKDEQHDHPSRSATINRHGNLALLYGI